MEAGLNSKTTRAPPLILTNRSPRTIVLQYLSRAPDHERNAHRILNFRIGDHSKNISPAHCSLPLSLPLGGTPCGEAGLGAGPMPWKWTLLLLTLAVAASEGPTCAVIFNSGVMLKTSAMAAFDD